MTLLELLVEKLPKHGGWPAGAVECVRFVDEATIDFYDEHGNWPDDCSLTYGSIAKEICRKPTEPCQRESVTLTEYEAALAASKPEWDGEGLPPVGCECMVRGEIGDDGWYECKVIAHTFFDGYNCAVFQTESTVSCSSEGNFRPIRSEADKKRDEIILQMSHSLRANGSVTEEQLCRLYSDIAAGYIPHIRID